MKKKILLMMLVTIASFATGCSNKAAIGGADGPTDIIITNKDTQTITQQEKEKESIKEFSDILGYTGYSETKTDDTRFCQRTYYAVLDDGSRRIIAESFGYELDDCAEDIDGDGVKELLCNCTYGADGVQELQVFTRFSESNVIEVGTFDPQYFDAAEWNNWGAGSLLTTYDHESKSLIVKYSKFSNEVDSDYGEKTFSEPWIMSTLKFNQFVPQFTANINTVQYSPTEIYDLESAVLHMDNQNFILTDSKSIDYLESLLSSAEELKGWPNCPYDATLYLTRKDGKMIIVNPATDSCNNFKAGDVWYEYQTEEGYNESFYGLFGI